MKRDDLVAEPLGGNKVRALEFLLGTVTGGAEVVTVGGIGSTHALSTAVYASRLGARTTVYRWPQVMNESARQVDALLRRTATVRDARWVGGAYLSAAMHRLTRRVTWIPAGGTAPLGILGHVGAALELAAQVRAGALPPPARVVLPLGSGGTAAGLLLGFAIAGLPAEIVAVQVVPRVMARASRVRRLATATRRLITRHTGDALDGIRFGRVRVERHFYGGAYGRALPEWVELGHRFRDAHGGAMLDATYSAKACTAAIGQRDPRGPTLFWNTFDSRLLVGGEP